MQLSFIIETLVFFSKFCDSIGTYVLMRYKQSLRKNSN